MRRYRTFKTVVLSALIAIFVLPFLGIQSARASIISDLNNIYNGIVNVYHEVAGPIQNDLVALLSHLPGRSNDNGLASAVANSVPVGDLKGLIGGMRGEVADFNGFIKALRANYAAFDAPAFRSQLEALYADFQTLRQSTRKLGCIDDPALTIGSSDPTFINTLIDHAPPRLLYVLKTFLDQTAPNWQTMGTTLNGLIPVGLTGFCAQPTAPGIVASAAVVTPPSKSRICAALNSASRPLHYLKFKESQFILGIKMAKDWTSDDKEVTAGAEVVAGGTGGTNAKNPANAIPEGLSDIVETMRSVTESLIARKESCEADEEALERDLEQCDPIVSNLLPDQDGGHLDEEIDIVDERMSEVGDAGLNTGNAATDLSSAQTARSSGDYRGAFNDLCSAETELLSGSSGKGKSS